MKRKILYSAGTIIAILITLNLHASETTGRLDAYIKALGADYARVDEAGSHNWQAVCKENNASDTFGAVVKAVKPFTRAGKVYYRRLYVYSAVFETAEDCTKALKQSLGMGASSLEEFNGLLTCKTKNFNVKLPSFIVVANEKELYFLSFNIYHIADDWPLVKALFKNTFTDSKDRAALYMEIYPVSIVEEGDKFRFEDEGTAVYVERGGVGCVVGKE